MALKSQHKTIVYGQYEHNIIIFPHLCGLNHDKRKKKINKTLSLWNDISTADKHNRLVPVITAEDGTKVPQHSGQYDQTVLQVRP